MYSTEIDSLGRWNTEAQLIGREKHGEGENLLVIWSMKCYLSDMVEA